MADFRKSLLLAAMALAVGVGTASAQTPGTCAGTTGAPPTLRSEGLEELTGSIVLSCNQVPQGSVNFDVTINGGTVGITSRNNGAEATVQVQPGGATVAGQLVTFTGGTTNGDLRFVGIPINSPNPVITISGIRINATTVGLSSGFGPVLATISVSNGVLPISQVTGGFFVGIVLPGFGGAGASTNFNLTSCATVVALPTGVDFTATIKEGFPTAFKAQTAGPNTDSETGPVAGALPANSGTQFAVTFGNVPSGISFYIPVSITSNSPTGTTLAQLVTAQGGTTVVTSGISTFGSVDYVQVTSGTTYYYNVEVADPSYQETWSIPIYSPGGNLTGTFAPTVTLGLAPTTGSNIAPEFLVSTGSGEGTVTLGASVSNTCSTSLLFPFLSNEAGFDTGISIAATGTDPWGSGVAGGTCTIYLYADAAGSAAPATAPTLTIPAGGEGHTTISAIDPGFQGYGIATCDFTYAHGFAFVTDGFGGGGRGLSEGYLPLILMRNAGPTGTTAPAESLNN